MDDAALVGEDEPPVRYVLKSVGDLPGDVGHDRSETVQLTGVVVQTQQRLEVDGEVDTAFTRSGVDRTRTALVGGDGRVRPGKQVKEHVGPDLLR